MSDQISWLVELAVRPGELDNLRSLTREMVAAAQTEPGVLIYERFISEDGQRVHVYERYADSAAALQHLRLFGDRFAARFLTMVERTRFTMYGVPSAELKAALGALGATFLEPFGGLAFPAS